MIEISETPCLAKLVPAVSVCVWVAGNKKKKKAKVSHGALLKITDVFIAEKC